jgi:hypothetical protein
MDVSSSAMHIPDALQMHRPYLNDMPNLLTLQNTISTATGHTGDIQELCSVDHMVIFTPSDTDTSGLNLKAQAAFVFPQGGGNTRLHARWWILAGCVERIWSWRHPGLTIDPRKRQNRLRVSHVARDGSRWGRGDAIGITILAIGVGGIGILRPGLE